MRIMRKPQRFQVKTRRARHAVRNNRRAQERRNATRATRRQSRRTPPKYHPEPRPKALVEPPAPPIELTQLVACSAETAQDVLWHIAEHAPRLRKWLVANPSATPAMLEYLAQVGGPSVHEALRILLESLESLESHETRRNRGNQPFIASTAL